MMTEKWKIITYAPNYMVSNFANVKNIKSQRNIFLNYDRVKKTNTRMRVGLSYNGKCKGYYLHRVVAEHFIKNTDNLPEVNHINGDCYNNRPENLEWISKIDNMRHAVKCNLINRYTRKIRVHSILTNSETIFTSVTDCALFFNCSAGLISQICNNKYNTKTTSSVGKPKRHIIQYNEKNEIICKFNSISEASKILKINNISGCCNYYEYDDVNRPACYKIKKIRGFIFKFDQEKKNFDQTIPENKFNKYNISYVDKEISDEHAKINNDKNIIWKEYPFNNKYLVSNTGEVKHKRTNRIMIGSKVNGYRFVLLSGDTKNKKNRLIHRMVAQTFLENTHNKPVVNHKDTNILNNHLDNLEWVTYKENLNTPETIKNLKQGKKSKNILQIEIDSGNIIRKFYGGSGCKDVSSNTVLAICNYYKHYKTKKSYGTQKRYKNKFIFIFEEDKQVLIKYLEIAKCDTRTKLQKGIVQIDKNSNNIINIFDSGYSASKMLNISYSGINQCCNYYKYDNLTRPKCYKLKSYKGYLFKFVN